MVLEMFKGLEKIDGFKISDDEVDAETPIGIYQPNIIQFQIQDGPIKEEGVNGCQVDTIIKTAKMIIEAFNEKLPCRENSIAITKLDEALLWLHKRKQDREDREVEGTNKE